MTPINYAISVVIILGFARIVFRGLVRRQYPRHGRLRWWATLAEVETRRRHVLVLPDAHLMVLGEEEHLTRALEEEYRDYRQRIPRYLPGGIRSRLFRVHRNQ
ncbi:MAG: hypothetical protein EHM45_17050 [Desulfobacteraceae bacterium]|nr:MAG: hypothetical protein EHM45_17050 [Desulfobacteraceae bacterium]